MRFFPPVRTGHAKRCRGEPHPPSGGRAGAAWGAIRKSPKDEGYRAQLMPSVTLLPYISERIGGINLGTCSH